MIFPQNYLSVEFGIAYIVHLLSDIRGIWKWITYPVLTEERLTKTSSRVPWGPWPGLRRSAVPEVILESHHYSSSSWLFFGR